MLARLFVRRQSSIFMNFELVQVQILIRNTKALAGQMWMRVDERLQLLAPVKFDRQFSSTAVALSSALSFELVQILTRVDERSGYARGNTIHCQLSLTLVQLLFSFDRSMRVEPKILMQILACQLSLI